MTKEEFRFEIDSLEEQFNKLKNVKTNILEVQSAIVCSDEYAGDEETYDRFFDAVDESLAEAKRNLRKLIEALAGDN